MEAITMLIGIGIIVAAGLILWLVENIKNSPTDRGVVKDFVDLAPENSCGDIPHFLRDQAE